MLRPMTRDQYRQAYRMARRMNDWRAYVHHAPRRFGDALVRDEAHQIWGAKRWDEACRMFPNLFGDTLVLDRHTRPRAAHQLRLARAGRPVEDMDDRVAMWLDR